VMRVFVTVAHTEGSQDVHGRLFHCM
jgi:hypothetical protein